MGCDFFWSGELPDIKLQEKVIKLAVSHYSSCYDEEQPLYIHPNAELSYLTQLEDGHYGFKEIQYPFDYYGIIPFSDYKLYGHRQFVFDRTANGRMVQFLKLPTSFNLPPDKEVYLHTKSEVVVNNGGHDRNYGDLKLALLLNLIRLRWWPEFEIHDEYSTCLMVADVWEDSNLVEPLKNETVDFQQSWDLFEIEYYRRYPKREPRPESRPKPILRIVRPNPEQILLDDLVSVRLSSCLKKMGIKTVGEIIKYSELDLKNSKVLGHKSLSELKELLYSLCVELRPE